MFDDQNRKSVIQDAHRLVDDSVRRKMAEESSIKTAELIDILVEATKRAEQRAIDAERASDEAINVSRKANKIAVFSIVIASVFALLSIAVSIA